MAEQTSKRASHRQTFDDLQRDGPWGVVLGPIAPTNKIGDTDDENEDEDGAEDEESWEAISKHEAHNCVTDYYGQFVTEKPVEKDEWLAVREVADGKKDDWKKDWEKVSVKPKHKSTPTHDNTKTIKNWASALPEAVEPKTATNRQTNDRRPCKNNAPNARNAGDADDSDDSPDDYSTQNNIASLLSGPGMRRSNRRTHGYPLVVLRENAQARQFGFRNPTPNPYGRCDSTSCDSASQDS